MTSNNDNNVASCTMFGPVTTVKLVSADAYYKNVIKIQNKNKTLRHCLEQGLQMLSSVK